MLLMLRAVRSAGAYSPLTVFLREQQKQARAASSRSSSRGMPMPSTRPRIRGFCSSMDTSSAVPVRFTLSRSGGNQRVGGWGGV